MTSISREAQASWERCPVATNQCTENECRNGCSIDTPDPTSISREERVAALAEHLCARRPCGDTPENVADWLTYSLQRCGLTLSPDVSQSEGMVEAHLVRDALAYLKDGSTFEAKVLLSRALSNTPEKGESDG